VKISRTSQHSAKRRGVGFSLVELLLVLALAALLILGLVQIVAAASAAGSLQRNQAQLQEHARLATSLLTRAIHRAGYQPQPWNHAFDPAALTDENRDGVTPASDRLAIRDWSDLNCFEQRNPNLDAAGRPLFYIREAVFDLAANHHLTRLCRYGPSAGELTIQVRRQGMVPDVESFQVLYGEDVDRDGGIDRWVHAGQWGEARQVLGVQIGLLLASGESVSEHDPSAAPIQVLDTTSMPPTDGKLRQVVEFSVAIRGRAP
jgi:type II secretory pathway pseudopilin PulG